MADQTNAEVSDERLREALRWISEIATANFEQDDKLRSQGARTLKRIADKADDALDALTRRSVTSQASHRAPVSKRVERLETLLTQALHVLDQPEIYTIWPVSALRMEITQALQGGRS